MQHPKRRNAHAKLKIERYAFLYKPSCKPIGQFWWANELSDSSKLKDRATGFNPRSNPTLILYKASFILDGSKSKESMPFFLKGLFRGYSGHAISQPSKM